MEAMRDGVVKEWCRQYGVTGLEMLSFTWWGGGNFGWAAIRVEVDEFFEKNIRLKN